MNLFCLVQLELMTWCVWIHKIIKCPRRKACDYTKCEWTPDTLSHHHGICPHKKKNLRWYGESGVEDGYIAFILAGRLMLTVCTITCRHWSLKSLQSRCQMLNVYGIENGAYSIRAIFEINGSKQLQHDRKLSKT